MFLLFGGLVLFDLSRRKRCVTVVTIFQYYCFDFRWKIRFFIQRIRINWLYYCLLHVLRTIWSSFETEAKIFDNGKKIFAFVSSIRFSSRIGIYKAHFTLSRCVSEAKLRQQRESNKFDNLTLVLTLRSFLYANLFLSMTPVLCWVCCVEDETIFASSLSTLYSTTTEYV